MITNRSSRVQNHQPPIQASSTELGSQEDYFGVSKSTTSSYDGKNNAPPCCELAFTDYFITLSCLLILLITLVGYITILNGDRTDEKNSNNSNQTINISDYPFPIPIPNNTDNLFDDDKQYIEFYMRCKVSIEKQFLMGCERIETQLVMKDTARVFHDEN